MDQADSLLRRQAAASQIIWQGFISCVPSSSARLLTIKQRRSPSDNGADGVSICVHLSFRHCWFMPLRRRRDHRDHVAQNHRVRQCSIGDESGYVIGVPSGFRPFARRSMPGGSSNQWCLLSSNTDRIGVGNEGSAKHPTAMPYSPAYSVALPQNGRAARWARNRNLTEKPDCPLGGNIRFSVQQTGLATSRKRRRSEQSHQYDAGKNGNGIYSFVRVLHL